jgi:hypothetical protein
MFDRVKRVANSLYTRSLQDNIQRLAARMRNKEEPPAPSRTLKETPVLPNLWDYPTFVKLAGARLGPVSQLTLLGDESRLQYLGRLLAAPGRTVTTIKWDWNSPIPAGAEAEEGILLICRIPVEDAEWRSVQRLRGQFGKRVVGIHELLYPFTVMTKIQPLLEFYLNRTVEQRAPFYLGEEIYGPLAPLFERVPLEGKSVIELGPFEAMQTAALVHAGAKSITCIEARAENYLKSQAACYGFGWDHVRFVMDDFHNADRSKYGEFDLAFAHGVYYHSIAPFLFLENLLSLAPNIFLGGFCATDDLPEGPYQTLQHEGRNYRVKHYIESVVEFTAGVNWHGYYFHKEDLMRFFQERGCTIEVISDEVSPQFAGNYLRFLARKT